jgi:hypothetical protein
MIKVKITTHNYSPSIKEDFPKYTPNQSCKWENFQFFLNENINECDYWVVFDHLPQKESVICPKENTIFITGECSAIKEYNHKFLQQFARIITTQRRIKHPRIHYMSQGHSWFPKKSYDELFGHDEVKKDKLISIVASNKTGTPGHKKRLDFCLNLKKHFGDKVDIFGRGINGFDDKWDVLAPYKYSIAIENYTEQDYLTEKIGDCFIALTFPFYYGCPNINDYYSPDSYELIDIDDFDKSVKVIENIISNEKHYQQHLKSLIESKNRYLNQYCLVPLIANFIKNEYNASPASIGKRITINPEKNYEKKFLKVSFYTRLFKRILNKIINSFKA